ncbi:MAG TPA: HAD family hydrolase [Gammaproteobacteria bacterium]
MSPPRPSTADLRCVTFDLDDTLWECMPVIEAAEAAAYDWLAAHCPRITAALAPAAMIAQRQAYMAHYPELHHDISALRRHWLASLVAEFGYGNELVEPCFQVFWHARNQVELYQEARDALDALHGVYKLGSITNGNADVHYIGIGHYFDFAITAAGVGAAKPDPRVFRAALDAAGVRPDQLVHVGDDPVRDVAAAAALGIRTVWVNPAATAWPGGPEPDRVIGHLGDLWGLLEAWRHGGPAGADGR